MDIKYQKSVECPRHQLLEPRQLQIYTLSLYIRNYTCCLEQIPVEKTQSKKSYLQDIVAHIPELAFNLDTVRLDLLDLALVALGLLLLLDAGDDSPTGATGTNDVFVGDGQQVTLLDAELDAELG